MTKKDYVLLAEAIKGAREDILTMFSFPSGDIGEPKHNEEQYKRLVGVRWTCDRIATALREENPRFDREKFEAACGYKQF